VQDGQKREEGRKEGKERKGGEVRSPVYVVVKI